MEVTSIKEYLNRNKPQSYRVACQAQQRRHMHLVTTTPTRDLTKWRRRMEQEVNRQKSI